MKQSIRIIVSLAIDLIVFIFARKYFLQDREIKSIDANKIVKTSKSSNSKNYIPNSAQIKNLISENLDASISIKSPDKTDKSCLGSFDGVLIGDIKLLKKFLIESKDFKDEECSSLILNRSGKNIESIQRNCIKSEGSSQCLNDISRLRSILVDIATENENIERLSTGILVQKIFSKNISKGAAEELKSNLSVIEELEKRDPSLGYSKLKAMVLSKIASADPTYSDEALQYEHDLYESDPEEGLKLIFRRLNEKGTQEQKEELLDIHLSKHPDSAYAYYLKAAMANKKRSMDEVSRYFATAIQIDSKDFFINEQLEEFREDPNNWNPAYMSPSFTYSLN